MTFKPAVWRPIAVVLSLVNLGAVAFAARAAEPMHAGLHAGLALVFAVWAQRLQPEVAGASELEERLAALEGEVSAVRGELAEAQERLDFAERLLAQIPESRRMGPER